MVDDGMFDELEKLREENQKLKEIGVKNAEKITELLMQLKDAESVIDRLRLGWDLESALSTPKYGRYKLKN